MRLLRPVIVAAVVGTLLVAARTAPSASAAVPVPPVPAGLPATIEPLAQYVAQTSCDPVTKPGTANLVALITRTYPGIYAGTTYACGTDGTRSEHYDGRAIDWMASIRIASQYAKAQALIAWFLKTDSHGNRFANARRLGVQYLIYNNRIWGSWNGQWSAYQDCAKTPSTARDSYCHRNHLHISLSWNGALGATTFWTKRTYPFEYGPCRSSEFNWAGKRPAHNFTRCPSYPTVTAPAGASTTKRNLVRYSGIYMVPGLRGPAAAAVQAALHVPVTSVYDTRTANALVAFEKAHRIYPSPVMMSSAWRALLAATR